MDKKWLKNPVNSDKTLKSLDLRTIQTLMYKTSFNIIIAMAVAV